MKTNQRVLLLLLLPVLHTAPLMALRWEYVNTLQNEWLRKICTQGLDTVYIVGDNGLIGRSPDRALTWTKQYPVNTPLNDILFCTHEVGFAVGDGGVILKTTDAGNTWTQIHSGTTEHINAIAATGLDNIWAVGENSLVLHSTNGGDIWSRKDLLTQNTALYDVEFSGSTGYIAGEKGTVFKTTDSALQWTQQVSELLTQRVHSLSFAGDKLFALMYDFVPAYGQMLTLDDNGIWSLYNFEQGFHCAGSIHFFNQNLGYCYDWTTSGNFALYIYHSANGGQTWTEMTVPRELNGGIASKSHFAFAPNNVFAYFLSGQILLRTPYTGDFYTDLSRIGAEEILKIDQHGEKLKLTTTSSKTISKTELLSCDGKRIQQASGSTIELSHIPSGVYVIRVTFTDKTNSVVKWVKTTTL